MRIYSALAAMMILIGCALRADAAQSAGVGKLAPAFVIDRLNGGKISLDDFRGRPIFLNFFATWCPPCKLELPYIVERYRQYENSVVFLGVDEQESSYAVSAFARHIGIAYEVGIDQGNATSEYAVGAIPVSVFIDRNGVVRAINRGYLTPRLLLQDLALIAGH